MECECENVRFESSYDLCKNIHVNDVHMWFGLALDNPAACPFVFRVLAGMCRTSLTIAEQNMAKNGITNFDDDTFFFQGKECVILERAQSIIGNILWSDYSHLLQKYGTSELGRDAHEVLIISGRVKRPLRGVFTMKDGENTLIRSIHMATLDFLSTLCAGQVRVFDHSMQR
jgi:hypothetical protein